MRIVRKNATVIIIVLVVAVIVFNYNYVEGFQSNCPIGKSLKCPSGYTIKYNNNCYKPCKSGFLFSLGVCNNKDRLGALKGKKYKPDSINLSCQ